MALRGGGLLILLQREITGMSCILGVSFHFRASNERMGFRIKWSQAWSTEMHLYVKGEQVCVP